MTTLAAPAHAPAVLTPPFGPGEASKALTRAVASSGARGNLGRALGRLRKETRAAAIRDVTAVAAGLLDANLGEALITGWQKHRLLTAAARRTLATPGSTELVDLAEYQVTWSQEPYVRVLIDGYPAAAVQLSLTVEFDVTGMLAKISAGRLVALEAGDCDITATIAVDGAEVIKKKTRQKLPGAVPLHGGIRLLSQSEHLLATQQAQVGGDDCRLAY